LSDVVEPGSGAASATSAQARSASSARPTAPSICWLRFDASAQSMQIQAAVAEGLDQVSLWLDGKLLTN